MVLIGYWPLNEASGDTAYDRSGQNNHGTLNGGITRGANGILGTTTYDFDGTEDYVTLPSAASSSVIDTSEWSITGWLYSDNWDSNNQQQWLSFGDGTQIELKTAQNGPRFRATTNDGSSFYTLDWTTPSDSTWYMVTVTYNPSGQWRLYVNGTQKDSMPAPGMQDQNSSNILGRKFNGSAHYFGRLADVRVYNHALTAQEIQYLYQVSQRGRMVSGTKQT